MSTYVIGDVQGCYEALRHLLETVDYDSKRDVLWFVGDLINRGPQSLETLRFVKSLKRRAVTVLGNHELHLLAIVRGGHDVKNGDTFQDVLQAKDCEELADWLRQLPLLHVENGHAMVHAGIPHMWRLRMARRLAAEVESVLRGKHADKFFEKMYGNEPAQWSDDLDGMDRHRLITNYFTRMRLISKEGRLDFSHKGTLEDVPAGFEPWFEHKPRVGRPVVFGHWAALDGVTGSKQMLGVDTGCVWGRTMTALRLEDHKRFKWENTDAGA